MPLSLTPGGLDFILYGTGAGVDADSVSVRIGTHTLKPVSVRRHADIAGLDEIRFHLDRDFPLRLYQTIAVETPEAVSNYLWIFLD